MALADYFDRDAQAASQVIAGFDRDAFERRVGSLEVGLAYGRDVADSPEGRALLDLVVRLLARLYPRIAVQAPTAEASDAVVQLAMAINPAIDTSTARRPSTGIVIGAAARPFRRSVFAGSRDWVGSVGTSGPFEVGDSDLPYGAGVAACLAAANVFRLLVLPRGEPDVSASFSALMMRPVDTEAGAPLSTSAPDTPPTPTVLVGAGAIGNGAAWAIARSADASHIEIVDPETVELSNLQRYVLLVRDDEGKAKAPTLAPLFAGSARAKAFVGSWQEYVSQHGHRTRAALVALDSAHDRRAVQASLPDWVANAWTQPGDLGVSTHSGFGGDGACLACLYLPGGRTANEDELYVRALGIPKRIAEVRTMLHQNPPLTAGFLDAVATALERPRELLVPFEGRSIRDLYVQGICGGAVLPLGSAGSVRPDIHVPLAFQSGLAGVLLAASLARHIRGGDPRLSEVTSIDLLRPLAPMPSRPERARAGCFCRDRDYVRAYRRKVRHEVVPN